MSTDSATAASLETAALASTRVSTASGTLMPSHLQNWSVFGRPAGANVRMILRGASPRLRHSVA